MKQILSVFLALLFTNTSFANHIEGGELYYEYLGGNQYEIHLVVFRDCDAAADFDNPANLAIYDSNDSLISLIHVQLDTNDIVSIDVTNTFSYSCPIFMADTCLEVVNYSVTATLPPINGGYLIVYQRCCLTGEILNVLSPSEMGTTVTCRIPGLETGYYDNNSARFPIVSPFLVCIDDPITMDHSAFDYDGDSIVYSLYQPFTGGDLMNPVPIPPNAPPYGIIHYETGFSESVPFGNPGGAQFDASTGELTFAPDAIGLYLVGLKAEEYRNGELLNETRKAIVVRVINSSNAPPVPIVIEIEVGIQIVPQHIYISKVIDVIDVFDTAGRKVLHGENVSEISTLRLSNGAYLIKVEHEGEVYLERALLE